MICHRIFTKAARAFTLVELLVVIAVISLLAGMLMATVSSARRSADSVKCMANLHQIGHAFSMYAIDNHNYWPMAVHQWVSTTAPFNRDKRWNHFISGYFGKPLNFDGDTLNAESSIKNKSSVIWGCPAWDRVAWSSISLYTYDSDLNNGYAMNLYASAPDTTVIVGSYANWVYRSIPYIAGSVSANGWYYHVNQWTHPADRALIFDSVNSVCAVGASWPWWTPTTASMPIVPNALTFTPDFNRHSKTKKSNRDDARTLNVLFCDTHVEMVSAREAFRAIRFK